MVSNSWFQICGSSTEIPSVIVDLLDPVPDLQVQEEARAVSGICIELCQVFGWCCEDEVSREERGLDDVEVMDVSSFSHRENVKLL